MQAGGFWVRLRLACEAPARDAGGWQRLSSSSSDDLPSPWLGWTLIGLIRHRRRQLWVGEVVRDRLGGSLAALASAGSMGHPEGRPQQGVAPGLIEWEYFFHGRGCCLTNRVTGEEVDVDFFGDHAEAFDPFFYLNHLRSLREPAAPERRLLDLHPSVETIRLAFDELCAAGFLVSDRYGPPVGGMSRPAPRLAEDVVAREGLVEAFCAAWADPDPVRRAWAAAAAGDWMAAADLLAASEGAAGGALEALARERAAAVRRLRADRLAAGLDGYAEAARRGDAEARSAASDAALCLRGLAEVGADNLSARLSAALRGPVSCVSSAALEVIEALPGAVAWCPEVWGLFERLDPGGDAPHPWLWGRCASFLLRHRHDPAAVLARLGAAGRQVLGEAALLALEHAPDPAAAALPLLRRALRSDVPMARSTAAAALALIDRPWARAELLAVMAESDQQGPTAECRAALAESREPEARAAVLAWERRNPQEPGAGPLVTVGEMMLRQTPEYLRYEMDKLRGRVLPLLARLPT